VPLRLFVKANQSADLRVSHEPLLPKYMHWQDRAVLGLPGLSLKPKFYGAKRRYGPQRVSNIPLEASHRKF